MSCGLPTAAGVLRCRDCVRAYRSQTDYRTLALREQGHDCAMCPAWKNRLIDRFYAWRRGQHGVLAVLLFAVRRWRRVEVDHIRRLASGGTHDRRNLQVLCRAHHARKTRAERNRRSVKPWPWKPWLAVACVVVIVAAVKHPNSIPFWQLALAGFAGLAGLFLLARARLRRAQLDRLWNADLVGLPKILKKENRGVIGWHLLLRSRETAYHVIPRNSGRKIVGTGWHWVKLPATKSTPAPKLPRYQPERLTLYYKGLFVPPDQRRRCEEIVSDMLGCRYRGVWDPARDRAELIPAPLPELVQPFPASPNPDLLLFALGEEGPVAWNVIEAPHLLVCGGTGSGKTATLRTVADAALRAGWEVAVADIKRIELRSLRGREGVVNFETELQAIARLISGTKSIMEDRYYAIETGACTRESYQPSLLVIDEVAEFVDDIRDWWKNPADGSRPHTGEPPVLTHLASLARKGRSARIHLAVGIQRPDVRFLSGSARDQYGARVACGPMSPDGSRMMFGDGVSARQVEQVPGRGLLQVGAGQPERLQVAWLPDEPGQPEPASPPVTAV